ncbi:MAG TPA: alpha/beta hydrolase [Candidatus Saccharimonadia bacterium]|nr:alpha/beta hydrolase [Candidatus Saccharimonadia bacterium]
MPTVLFIPGARTHRDDYPHNDILGDIEVCGYSTRFVPIEWWTDDSRERRTGWDDWLPQVKPVYDQYQVDEVVLVGFSVGALLAFALAAERSPASLWLVGMSPYFPEDLPHLKPGLLARYDEAAMAAFRRLQFEAWTAAITCPTQILVGEHDLERTKVRAWATHRAIAGSQLTLVPGVGHSLAGICRLTLMSTAMAAL